jgi:hypothetical protein
MARALAGPYHRSVIPAKEFKLVRLRTECSMVPNIEPVPTGRICHVAGFHWLAIVQLLDRDVSSVDTAHAFNRLRRLMVFAGAAGAHGSYELQVQQHLTRCCYLQPDGRAEVVG